ncbi:MAG TPA: alpha/beta hydrolase [Limnobacter sp.]|nr:alpha/beta hydrolase [Limnobacter sp.]
MSNPVMNWISRRLIDSKCKQMGLQRRRVETPDGQWVLYTGGKGPNMWLVHGFGANKENWLALAPRLMRHYTVWIPDLIGFGESERPANAVYGIADQAARLDRLAAHLGAAPYHVMGNSMGGYLAGALAANHSEHVLSACMLNPAGVRGAEHTQVATAFLEQGKVMLAPTSHEEYLRVVELCFNGKAPPMPNFMRRYFSAISVRNKDLLDRVFVEFTHPDHNESLNDMVARSRVPLMTIWGDSDQLVHPSGLGILRQAQPVMRVLMLENTGHCPMVDRASMVYKAHLEFIKPSA